MKNSAASAWRWSSCAPPSGAKRLAPTRIEPVPQISSVASQRAFMPMKPVAGSSSSISSVSGR